MIHFDESGEDWLIVVAAVVLFIVGALLGGKVVSIAKNAEIAVLKKNQAEAQAASSQAALQRLQAAQSRGDSLQTQLEKMEQARKTQAQEHSREIQRLTTGRPCLNAGTVRLLNQPTEGIHLGSLPAAAGGSPSAGARTRPDPDAEEVATDTDVAGWIDYAKRQYGTCRDRLQALIDWWQE